MYDPKANSYNALKTQGSPIVSRASRDNCPYLLLHYPAGQRASSAALVEAQHEPEMI